MASSTSILYHDPAYNIILIDVPHSLSLAQGENLRIVSSKSLERPYPSTEPLKSLKQVYYFPFLSYVMSNGVQGKVVPLSQGHYPLKQEVQPVLYPKHLGFRLTDIKGRRAT